MLIKKGKVALEQANITIKVYIKKIILLEKKDFEEEKPNHEEIN